MADLSIEESGWSASHRFARLAPRKARLVMGLIRGMACKDALDALRFNPRRAAKMISTVLKSAMSNANENEADLGRLSIVEARVDEGPTMKRWRPKDRGRAHPIKKRTSHLIIRITESDGGRGGSSGRPGHDKEKSA